MERTSWLETFLLAWLLPIGLLAAIWFFLMRRLQGARGGPLSIGKNKARIYDASEVGRVTFDDVAGVDEAEAELVEVVDFLKSPQKYRTALSSSRCPPTSGPLGRRRRSRYSPARVTAAAPRTPRTGPASPCALGGACSRASPTASTS